MSLRTPCRPSFHFLEWSGNETRWRPGLGMRLIVFQRVETDAISTLTSSYAIKWWPLFCTSTRALGTLLKRRSREAGIRVRYSSPGNNTTGPGTLWAQICVSGLNVYSASKPFWNERVNRYFTCRSLYSHQTPYVSGRTGCQTLNREFIDRNPAILPFSLYWQ